MRRIIKWYDTCTYSTNPIIDAYLLNCLDSGIKAMVYYTEDDKFAGCEFNNGIFYKFWNVNMPYAWLSEGRFIKNFNIIFQYCGSMPSKRVMNKFYDAIYKFALKSEL